MRGFRPFFHHHWSETTRAAPKDRGPKLTDLALCRVSSGAMNLDKIRLTLCFLNSIEKLENKVCASTSTTLLCFQPYLGANACLRTVHTLTPPQISAYHGEVTTHTSLDHTSLDPKGCGSAEWRPHSLLPPIMIHFYVASIKQPTSQ
jgi:hypothetical protein